MNLCGQIGIKYYLFSNYYSQYFELFLLNFNFDLLLFLN